MSYCTKHIIQIVSKKKLRLSDYVRLNEILAEKVNDDFNVNKFNFNFNQNSQCITDNIWNYGFGMDWPNFKENMIKLSKVGKKEIKCAWIAEDENDNGFLHVKNGEVIEDRKLSKNDKVLFKQVYYIDC